MQTEPLNPTAQALENYLTTTPSQVQAIDDISMGIYAKLQDMKAPLDWSARILVRNALEPVRLAAPAPAGTSGEVEEMTRSFHDLAAGKETDSQTVATLKSVLDRATGPAQAKPADRISTLREFIEDTYGDQISSIVRGAVITASSDPRCGVDEDRKPIVENDARWSSLEKSMRDAVAFKIAFGKVGALLNANLEATYGDQTRDNRAPA